MQNIMLVNIRQKLRDKVSLEKENHDNVESRYESSRARKE